MMFKEQIDRKFPPVKTQEKTAEHKKKTIEHKDVAFKVAAYAIGISTLGIAAFEIDQTRREFEAVYQDCHEAETEYTPEECAHSGERTGSLTYFEGIAALSGVGFVMYTMRDPKKPGIPK